MPTPPKPARPILENMKLTAQADLAVDYYQLRGQDQLIQLFNDTVKAYRDTLDLTTTLYKTGIDSQLNQAQADALLETTLAQSTALAIQRAQYEHAIALLVGQPASTFSLNVAPIKGQPPIVPVGLPSSLLERRPGRGVGRAHGRGKPMPKSAWRAPPGSPP